MDFPKSSVVYADTGVLIPIFIKRESILNLQHKGESERAFHSCAQFFNEVQGGRIKGVVGVMTIFEALTVVSKLVSEKNGRAVELSELEKWYQRAFDYLVEYGFEIQDMEPTLTESSGSDSFVQRSGRFALSVAPYMDSRGEWKTMSLMDGMHTAFAEDAGATHMITTDQDLTKVKSKLSIHLVWSVYK